MTVFPSIIVPACGHGLRFGSDTPKHLVDIAGRPMVQRVIDALPDEADIYLLVRPEYVSMTRERITRARVVPVHACARGVCETLLSAPVDPRDKVLVVNCDNVILPP